MHSSSCVLVLSLKTLLSRKKQCLPSTLKYSFVKLKDERQEDGGLLGNWVESLSGKNSSDAGIQQHGEGRTSGEGYSRPQEETEGKRKIGRGRKNMGGGLELDTLTETCPMLCWVCGGFKVALKPQPPITGVGESQALGRRMQHSVEWSQGGELH